MAISFPFEIEDGYSEQDYKVYYIREDGEVEEMSTVISGGNLSFETNHFSDFALVNTAATVKAPTSWIWMIIVGIVILATGVVLVLVTKKRKPTVDSKDSISDYT